MLGGTIMEEKKNDFLEWVKAHKKQLVLAGIGVSALVVIVFGIMNKDDLVKLWVELEERINKVPRSIPTSGSVTRIATPETEIINTTRSYTCPQEPINVRLHIRTLNGGRTHSAEKAAEAIELGIELLPNQTLVDPYVKYAA